MEQYRVTFRRPYGRATERIAILTEDALTARRIAYAINEHYHVKVEEINEAEEPIDLISKKGNP